MLSYFFSLTHTILNPNIMQIVLCLYIYLEDDKSIHQFLINIDDQRHVRTGSGELDGLAMVLLPLSLKLTQISRSINKYKLCNVEEIGVK